MREKIAIIVSGGGMSCSYIAGALLALAEKHNIREPSILIGGSGGIITAAYYVTRQYKDIPYIAENYLTSKKTINLKRFWRIVDIDYIIDGIIKKEAPLDMKKLKNAKTNFIIALTNADNGMIRYFSNKEYIDLFEAMRATLAMPIAYGKKININNEHFIDTYISANTELNILKAIELGIKKIIVIDNKCSHPLNMRIFRLWLKRQNKLFQKNYKAQEEIINNFKIPKNVKIININPKKPLNIHTFNNNIKNIQETMNQGYNQVAKMKGL